MVDKTKKYAFASPPVRLKAFLIDAFFIAFPIAIIVGLITGYDALKHKPDFIIIASEIILIGIVFCVFWIKTGQTPGKKALGLTVAMYGTFEPVSPIRAFFRYLFWIACWASLGIGFFMAYTNNRRRTLADVLSGTVVVKELPAKEE